MLAETRIGVGRLKILECLLGWAFFYSSYKLGNKTAGWNLVTASAICFLSKLGMWMSAGKTPLPVIFPEAIYCWKKKWASWSINSIMWWRTSFPLTICQKYSHSRIRKWPVICPKQEQMHPGNTDEPGPVSTEGFFPAHGSTSQRAAKQSHGEILANTPAQCGHICACPALSRARLGTCM